MLLEPGPQGTPVTVSFVVDFPKRISDQARKLENWNQTWENTCQNLQKSLEIICSNIFYNIYEADGRTTPSEL